LNVFDKSILTNAWQKLWPTMMLENEDFEGFHATNDKQMISNIVTYAKSLSAKSVNKLEEVEIEDMLNIDNDAPVVHSFSDGENAEMVLKTDKHEQRWWW
jgi:hypothetical protein